MLVLRDAAIVLPASDSLTSHPYLGDCPSTDLRTSLYGLWVLSLADLSCCTTGAVRRRSTGHPEPSAFIRIPKP